MKIQFLENIDICIIEDVFRKNEKKEIFSELCDYVEKGQLLPPELTGSARDKGGLLKKQNSALFLDHAYDFEQRKRSAILNYTENILLSHEMKSSLENFNNLYGILRSANKHFTLVNYYEDTDYYDFHFDVAAFSILSFFFKEPKQFSGGNVVFKVKGVEFEVEIKSNMSIFFPSFYEHKVLPVKIKNKKGLVPGRFSIAQFIFIS